MRINVYSQELTKEIEAIAKLAADTGITYYGVRMYLASPDISFSSVLCTAITFWIPNAESFTKEDLAKVFDAMALAVRKCPEPERNG